jgi:hypothetical protein
MAQSQVQRNSLLGDLYYDNQPIQYIAPPNQALKDLGKAKEADYITTMGGLNEMDTILRSLPKDTSPELYNTIKQNYDKVIGGINPDNYSDKMIDVKQFAHDFKNKMGVNELLQEQKIIQEGKKTIQDAIDKGDIVTDEMKNEAFSKLLRGRASLTIDPTTGMVTKPSGVNTNYNPYVSGQELTMKQIEGWKANSNIITDPVTGKLSAGPGLPAHLGYQTGEEVSMKDKVNANGTVTKGLETILAEGLKSNPKYMAYASDVANVRSRNIPDNMTPEYIQSILPKGSTETLENIKAGLLDGRITPEMVKQRARNKILDDYIKGEVQLAAEKGSYKNIDQHYVKDPLWERANFLADRAHTEAREDATTAAKPAPFDPSITSETTSGFAETKDPLSVSSLKEKESSLAGNITNLYKDRNLYAKRTDADPTRVKEMNKEIQRTREKLLYIKRAQEGKQTDLINRLKREGVDIYKTFNENKGEALKEIVNDNLRELSERETVVDVSSKISHKNGKTYITVTKDGVNKTVPIDTYSGITKSNGGYFFKPSSIKNTGSVDLSLKDLKDIVLDVNGQPTDKVTSSASNLSRLPSKKEFTAQIAQDYEDNRSGDIIGNTYKLGNVIYPNKVRDILQENRSKNNNKPLNIEMPLSVIRTTGADKKSPDRAIVELNKHFTQDFKENTTNYKVESPTGDVQSLGTYLKQTYGINLGTDTKDLQALVTSSASPSNGQYYQGMIEITPEAIKSGKINAKALSEGKYLKIPLVAPGQSAGNKAAIDSQIKKAFTGSVGDRSPNGIQKKLALGSMHAAGNSNIAKDIKSAVIHASSPGEIVPLKVNNRKYEVVPVAESGVGSDSDSQSYTLRRIVNNSNVTLQTDASGNDVWAPEGTRGLAPHKFANEEELISYYGAKDLESQYKNETPPSTQPVSTSTYQKVVTRTKNKY